MNPNDLIRNQQLNKLRGDAMGTDEVPAGLSKRIDPDNLHFSNAEEENDEITNELEDDFTEETEIPEEEDN